MHAPPGTVVVVRCYHKTESAWLNALGMPLFDIICWRYQAYCPCSWAL